MRRLAVLLLLAFAAPAEAATVEVDRTVVVNIREDIQTSTVIYRSAPGERNRLVARARGNAVLITDRGARIEVGRRCRSLGRHRARCRFDTRLDPYFQAALRDGADRFRERSAADFVYEVAGGSGADRLLGGPGGDDLDGATGNDTVRGGAASDDLTDGPGRDAVAGGAGADALFSFDGKRRVDDRFDGGAGTDQLSYESRAKPVTGRLNRTAGVGAERDRLAGLEGLGGGGGDDALWGNEGPNVLDGGGGGDRLHGGGGDDRLLSGFSYGRRELVFGGAGADRVFVGESGRVACGPGRDRVRVDDSVALLLPDCERVADDALQDVVLPAQPLRVTPRRVVMALPCAYANRPRVRQVRLFDGKRVLARGRRRTGDGTCRVRLRLRSPLRRPVVAQVRYFGTPDWRFVLRP